MTYDFDTPIDRSGTYSLKWEEAGDALPMWVADMDFQTAPVIREALRRRVEHGVFGYSIVPPEWNQAYVVGTPSWACHRPGFAGVLHRCGAGDLQHGQETHHAERERRDHDAGLQHLLQFLNFF
mgnify:CR=1 FL=1